MPTAFVVSVISKIYFTSSSISFRALQLFETRTTIFHRCLWWSQRNVKRDFKWKIIMQIMVAYIHFINS